MSDRREQMEKLVRQRCEAMRASGREFNEDAIRREHARAEEKADRRVEEAKQAARFTRSKSEYRPPNTTTIIDKRGNVETVKGDISAAEAFGETGVSNISRNKNKVR